MSKLKSIQRAIEKEAEYRKERVLLFWKKKYKNMKIGITANPTVTKKQLGAPKSWVCWEAETEDEAKKIVSYFLEKGMKLAHQDPEQQVWQSLYVYVL